MGRTFDDRHTHGGVIGTEAVVERHAQKESVQGGGDVGVRSGNFPFVSQIFGGDVRTGQSVVVILFAVKTDTADMLITGSFDPQGSVNAPAEIAEMLVGIVYLIF